MIDMKTIEFQKTNEIKVMRDVVHGYIHVDYQVVWDCINAKEFQRLRRIKQLGGVYAVYHTAEHSRFTHSLGEYEIVRRMVSEIEGLAALSEYDKVTVMLAGLLHDIGHLPFSHASERLVNIAHEEFSQRVILEDTEIHQILVDVDPGLAQAVADVIAYQHPNPLLNQIVSGQLDADRMDYLLRDSYMSGTSYGKFDLERILRTIRIKENRIVVKESGIHSIEDYIMSRYHMYWQVYYHSIARSYEAILNSIYKRMKFLYDHDFAKVEKLIMFHPFLRGNPSIYDHFVLDEHAADYGFGLALHGEDPILSDLCERLLDRHLFEHERIEKQEDLERITQRVQKAGYDPEYYVVDETTMKNPYSPYGSSDTHNIYILLENGEIKELSEVSVIVKSLVEGDIKKERLVFYPSGI